MPLAFRAKPRISAAQFEHILERYQSPCAAIAQECYQVIVRTSLDPAVALAFFGHESVFGTRGTAVETKNWGNVRTAFKPERSTGTHPRNFAMYATWQDGLLDWCERINERYIRERGLDTIEKAIPVYAPTADGNQPQVYIDHVTKLVAEWMAEDNNLQPGKTPDKARVTLRNELLEASFAQSGSAYRPDTPMHQYVLKETRAGRPLGNPLGDMRQIRIQGDEYLIQVFALDTLYSPIQNLSEVYRLSELIKET